MVDGNQNKRMAANIHRNLPLLILGCCLAFTSCIGDRHLLSDHNLIVDHKWFSPDHSKILIQYKYDTGAYGYSRSWDALIPASEIDKNNNISDDLSQYLLPDQYEPVQWEKDNSLTVKINCMAWYRKGKDFFSHKDKDFLYGTPINVLVHDETAGLEQEIEADLPSPNGKLRLVAYRYPTPDFKRLHVSIIRSDESIPRHGNFYISSGGHDGLLKGEWKNDREIIFYTTSVAAYSVSGGDGSEGFIKNIFGIQYQIVVDDRILPRYHWVKE
jgi:hypothetical protein